jgi:hypothetical protein
VLAYNITTVYHCVCTLVAGVRYFVRLILEEGLQSDLPQTESDTPQTDELQPVEKHRLDESAKGLTKTYWNTHEIFLYRSRYALLIILILLCIALSIKVLAALMIQVLFGTRRLRNHIASSLPLLLFQLSLNVVGAMW